jgi:protein-S-isoprenylcysteine O-methyltransferase Ste14
MNILLDIVVSLVSVAAIAQYTWSMRGHFSSDAMPRGALLLSVVVITAALLFLLLLWTGEQPLLAQVVGVLIELASLGLFWAAIRASRQARLRLAFDPGNPRSFVAEGPYKYIRHPFYTSYLIFWSGWAIAAWSPWTLIPLAIMVGIYVGAARDEERKFAETSMAADYAAYKARTGQFLPRLGN